MAEDFCHLFKFTWNIVSIKGITVPGDFLIRQSPESMLKIQPFESQDPITISSPYEFHVSLLKSNKFLLNESQAQAFSKMHLLFDVLRITRNNEKEIVGQFKFNFSEILEEDEIQTQKTFIRSLDKYIDLNDANGKKKGEVRAKFFLEDFGPEDELEELSEDEFEQEEYQEERKNDFLELEEIVKFEMDVWKKDQSKIYDLQFQLKKQQLEKQFQKEIDDLQKENMQTIQNILQSQNKQANAIKESAKSLQQKENALIYKNQEIHSKINQSVNTRVQNDEDLLLLHDSLNEKKNNHNLTKIDLENKLKIVNANLEKVNQECSDILSKNKRSFKDILDNDLSNKSRQVIDIENNIKDNQQMTESLKNQCEQLKQEIIKIKDKHKSFQNEQDQKHREEMQNLQAKIYQIQNKQDDSAIRKLQLQLQKIQENPSQKQRGAYKYKNESTDLDLPQGPPSNGNPIIKKKLKNCINFWPS